MNNTTNSTSSTTAGAPQPASLAVSALPPSGVVAPAREPHPLRFAIKGVTDMTTDLQAFVNGLSYDAGVKSFLVVQLGKLKTNAATIHLHDVARPDGGFDLVVTVSGVNLGATPGAVVTGAGLTAGE